MLYKTILCGAPLEAESASLYALPRRPACRTVGDLERRSKAAAIRCVALVRLFVSYNSWLQNPALRHAFASPVHGVALNTSLSTNMADPLSGIQTADAIVGLITAVIQVVKYCQKLRTASKLADQVLERFLGLEPLLEAVRQICIDPAANALPQLPTSIGHIKSVVDACERTVRRIELKLGVYFDSSAGSHHNRTNARAPGLSDQHNLVGALPEIHGHLENLNAHKHTLSLWFNILT